MKPINGTHIIAMATMNAHTFHVAVHDVVCVEMVQPVQHLFRIALDLPLREHNTAF